MLRRPSLEESLTLLLGQLRSGQQEMATWQGGELAVSAVPGAGKSTGLAVAAAVTIVRHQLTWQRLLLVVTFTRSAATNLKAKIRAALAQIDHPPIGFLVHTLHGLALQIATRHPEWSGLSLETRALVAPTQNHRLIQTCVDQWIAENPGLYQSLLEGRQFDGEESERLRRQSVLRTEVLPELATTVIREAKSSGLLPNQLHNLSQTLITAVAEGSPHYPVLEIAAGLYDRYQAQLQYRGLIDYDDMILAALRVLQHPQARQFWQRQIFAVFEDEAQDSTPLQTQLLEILATDPDRPFASPDLLRVGDPNQAINSTFTPADPTFFKDFCQRCQGQNRLVSMVQAGRSSQIIMDAANFMLEWVNQNLGSFRPQHIQPVSPDDPQPNANPEPEGAGVEIHRPGDIQATLSLLRHRVMALVRSDRPFQGAVLVRENRQGQFLARQLQDLESKVGIRVYEVGQEERSCQVPVEMLTLLQWLQRPHSPDYLKAALRVLCDRKLIPNQDLHRLAIAPEQFLYPSPLVPALGENARLAQRLATQLLQARLVLAVRDLIPFLGFSLGYDQTELATADQLLDWVLQRNSGDLSLSPLIDTLTELINTGRFEPVDPENLESRYTQPQQLTVITMHKAKGLDWDYVFIPFLQAQTIPGERWIPPQSQFLGDFTLPEIARAQIRSYLHQLEGHHSSPDLNPQPPNPDLHNPDPLAPDHLPNNLANALPVLPDTLGAWQAADRLKQEEEYRLLYVAMTRPKRLLWMAAAQQAPFTWNKPESLCGKPPCPVIPPLQQYLRQYIQQH